MPINVEIKVALEASLKEKAKKEFLSGIKIECYDFEQGYNVRDSINYFIRKQFGATFKDQVWESTYVGQYRDIFTFALFVCAVENGVIGNVCVEASYRNRGVARKCLQEVMQLSGAKKVNNCTRALYDKLYKPLG